MWYLYGKEGRSHIGGTFYIYVKTTKPEEGVYFTEYNEKQYAVNDACKWAETAALNGPNGVTPPVQLNIQGKG